MCFKNFGYSIQFIIINFKKIQFMTSVPDNDSSLSLSLN